MLRILAVALVVLAAPFAHAADDDDDRWSNWSLGIALGYGQRSNPLIQSEDIPILVDVDIAWFGKRLFFDNGDLGWTLSDNDAFTLNFIGRVNSDRVFFGKTNSRIVQFDLGSAGMVSERVTVPDRDYAIEAGAEFLADGDWGRLQLAAFHDVSNTHDGWQARIDYSFGIRRQRWYLEPSIGIGYKSRRLNDYYWGIDASEQSLALSGYDSGAGSNVGLRLLGSYQLSRHWTLSAVFEYERLSDAVTDSPIVRDDHVAAFFSGFGYRF